MMELINLALRTEFSFRKTFQHIKKITDGQKIAVGIADLSNTFGHVKLEQECKKAGIKPIFGVRLMVVPEPKDRPKGQQGNYGPWYIFLAKNQEGVKEINRLVKSAYDQFFYRPVIGHADIVAEVTGNIIIISTTSDEHNFADYIGINFSTPKHLFDSDKPKVFINDNLYPDAESRKVYQLMCGARKARFGYSYNFESHTYPSHILTANEFLSYWDIPDAVANSHIIADQCNVELPKAKTVKYKGARTIENWCKQGARKRLIDLDNPVYSERLSKEIDLIHKKDFADYFLNVADIVNNAKKTMLVGPSRGSSAGSLVCYLMGITEVDPIKYGLLFERFIDINRFDTPDIDVDFPDTKRDKVIKYIEKTHGADNVYHIATVSTFKPKKAIGEFAIGLGIPQYETEAVKDAIIERSGGDARAAMCIKDTLESTDIGKELTKKYPAMNLTSEIEGHATHPGVHAAGIIICNDEMTNYGGVNTRDHTIMMDKYDAEYSNLLKFDCLGLRTLSILEDCARLARFDKKVFYDLPLDDENVFAIFNSMRLQGIFQFEGHSLQFITRQIGVHHFNDIVAITALARPGAMNSGGTARYVKYKLGEEKPSYKGDVHRKITNESMGIVIYQEQMMSMAKEIGNMTWEDVSNLRKAASKSLGDEFFSQFKDKFIKGATKENSYSQGDAEALWHDISATGSWTFNKSHAVSYGLISYWTAWCKAYHPLEFAAANLNNAKGDDSALRLLRDFVINDGIEYVPFDPDNSEIKWSIHDGKLLGGLENISGIGPKKAQSIIKARREGKGYTPSIVEKLMNPVTVFDDIFPCETKYGDIYKHPGKYGLRHGVSKISDVIGEGEYIIIGKLKMLDLRDRNDYQSVVKRGGTKVDKNQFYLKMFVEDDTDSIMVMIPPHKFDELGGRELSETSKVNETWFMIKGSVRNDWRMITISTIHDITSLDMRD